MLKYVQYEVVQNENGTWDCLTYNEEVNAHNYNDFTGVGMSAAEALTDWIDSNDILVDGSGNCSYSIQLD